MIWYNFRRGLREKRQWHRWFAWHPVSLGIYLRETEQSAWLCWLERKLEVADEITRYSYRLPGGNLGGTGVTKSR